MKKSFRLYMLLISILFIGITTSYAASNEPSIPGGQNFSPPRIISFKAPVYPVEAGLYNLSKSVNLKMKIRSDGSVGKITIVKSSGYKLLDNAVLSVAKTWRYAPATNKDGVPIEVAMFIRVMLPVVSTIIIKRCPFIKRQQVDGVVKQLILRKRIGNYGEPCS